MKSLIEEARNYVEESITDDIKGTKETDKLRVIYNWVKQDRLTLNQFKQLVTLKYDNI